MESTQVLELTPALEASQSAESSDVAVKVGCLKINGVDHYILNKENTIGRDESCDVVINSKAVSVEHAIIEADAFGKHLIWDLGSTNKTRLGEIQLKPRVRHYLNDGARLRFANVNAVYHHVKVISPQKQLFPEPVAMQIPGTPERIEEDAAAIASIVEESPGKNDENDSDGDFFGENDSSALFMRPLVEDRSASPGDQNRLCTNATKKSSPTGSEAPTPGARLQLNPRGQVMNEASVCEADTSGANSGEDLSDVIVGSQPMFTPEKALNIYEMDTVPDRVEETPVKALENDELNWEDIDESISQISQEMDTIDTLIENKELRVEFTPTKRIADSTSEENGNASSATVNPESSNKSVPANRNLGSCFGESTLAEKPQDSSPNSSSMKPCVVQSHEVNIYDVETEPLAVVGTKMETNGNIFDLATQEVHGLVEESVRPKVETSVYDVATQQFFATESKKAAGDPVLGDTVDPSPSPENTVDVSMSDLPTQAAGGLDRPVLGSDERKGSIPPSHKIAHKEAVLEMAVPIAHVSNGESLVDNSLCDMLTQTAAVITTNGNVSECRAKTNEQDPCNVSISDMATQLSNERSQIPPQGARETEPRGNSSISTDIPTEVPKSDIQSIDDLERNHLGGLGNVSLSDMLTQTAEKNSVVTVSESADVPTQGSPLADVSLADLQTQMVADAVSNHPTGSCADVSLSDLQTQVAAEPHRSRPDELITADVSISDVQTQIATTVPEDEIRSARADVSISDLQTQVAAEPHRSRPDELITADVSISDLQTQVAASLPEDEIRSVRTDGIDLLSVQTQPSNPPTENPGAPSGAVGPDSEDIYNVMTQMPVADHQIMCEDSNTEQIELELHRYEKETIDSLLGKSSDGSSDNAVDSTSPFKTPALKVDARPSNSSSDTPIDDVYLLDTQPMHVVDSSRKASGETDGFKASNTEGSKNTIGKKLCDPANQKVSSEQAKLSIYDVETQAVAMTKEDTKRGEMSIYDVETQDFGKAEKDTQPMHVIDSSRKASGETDGFKASNTEGSKNTIGGKLCDPANQKVSSEQAKPSIYDVETQAVAMIKEDTKRAEMSIYDVETQDFGKAEEVGVLGDDAVPLVEAESVSRPAVAETSVDKDSSEEKGKEEKSAPVSSRLSKHRYSQDLDANSVENRIRAMTDTNVNTPLTQKGPLSTKSTVAELLETLEGTQNVPVGRPQNPGETGLSQNSDTLCSQFPAKKPHKKVKTLVYTDSEDSRDSIFVAHGKEHKSLSGVDRAVDSKTGDVSHDSNVRCSQFPVEKVHKKVKVLAYSDSEDSWDSPLPAQKKKKKRSEGSDIARAICPSKDSKTVVDSSRGSLHNGNSLLSKEGSKVSLVPKESRMSKTEPPIVSVDAVTVCETSVNNGTGGSESLRLQLSDVSTFMEEKSRDIATPEKSDAANKPENSEENLSANVTPTCTSELDCAKKDSLASLAKESESKSPQVVTTNSKRIVKALPETPEIPKDFFGTPVVHERPPVRQYVNKKKLSLNTSSLLKGPNASSTPLSDKDCHSVIDMEETLITTIPKTDGKTVEKTAESVDYRGDSSQSDTPKNVKKFRKSPVKKPSQDSQLFSQDSETLSSQDELMDSQDLGRGKRKRVKKNFFGYDEGDENAASTALSPKPQSPPPEMKVATSSKVRDDNTAQPLIGVSPVLPDPSGADAPRRERPRKQAFMSCDANEACNPMERFRNDARYIKSPPKLVDAPSNVVETVAVVHKIPDKSSPVEMDLTKMKNSLKASMARGFAVQKAGKESVESKSPAKPKADVPKSSEELISLEKSPSVPKSRLSGDNESLDQSLKSDGSHNLPSPIRRGRGRPPKNKSTIPTPSSEVPAREVCGVDMPKSPVRPGRGRRREVGASAEPSGGLNSLQLDTQPCHRPSPSPVKSDVANGNPSTSSNAVICTEKGKSSNKVLGDTEALTQDLNIVPKSPTLPSRGRRRKESPSESSSATDQGLHSTLASRPDDSNAVVRDRRRRVQRDKDVAGSQDSQPDHSQESQSSVSSSNAIKTRGACNTPFSPHEITIPENMDERSPRKRRARKLSAGSKHLKNLEAVDEHVQNMPTSIDEEREMLETAHEPKIVVAETSVPLTRGRGRPRKPIGRSPVPEPEQEPSSSPSSTNPPDILKRRPNQRGFKRKQDELSQDSQPEVPIISSGKGARKRGKVETTMSVENSDVDPEQGDGATTGIQEGPSQRFVKKRGTKPVASEDRLNDSPSGSQSSSIALVTRRRGNRNAVKTPQLLDDSDIEEPAPEEVSAAETASSRKNKSGAKPLASQDRLTDSPSGSQSSSIASVTRRRGNRNAAKTPHLLDDSDVEDPAPEEVSATETASSCKTRGRPKKAVQKAADSSLPAREESNVIEIPSASKTRGRRKKNGEDSTEGDSQLQPASKEVSTTEVPPSKTRGRPKKAAEAADEDISSQDLSQGRRSGRTRKKKESFDELVSRKEEEIRLKKLQRTGEQSPSPDKVQRLSVVTPCASVSDESAFSIPASPASSIAGKRSASRLGTSSAESLPSPSKRKKKEDLPSTSSSGPVKVMFTALGDNKLSATVKKLGGKVVEKPTDCTVLVTDKVIRTVKFLCAFGRGIPIVSPNWVSKSRAFSQFTDPYESLLKDTEGEKKFDFELSSSLEKAKSQKLLEGYSVYTTASILPPPKEMKPIIECSGGTFLAKPPAKWRPQSVIISDPKDKAEWPKLSKNGVTPPILSAEAILTGILQQQFDLEKHRLK